MATEIIEEIHVEDIGTILKMTIKNGASVVDLSTTTTKNIHFEKPSGATTQRNASFVTDGTDGIIKYTSVSGDFDESGVWQMQVYIINLLGQWKTNIVEFSVFPNLI